jgi:hypothetical protein
VLQYCDDQKKRSRYEKQVVIGRENIRLNYVILVLILFVGITFFCIHLIQYEHYVVLTLYKHGNDADVPEKEKNPTDVSARFLIQPTSL